MTRYEIEYYENVKKQTKILQEISDSLKKITKRVNGGYNGYDDRKKYFCGYWKKLQEDPTLYT